MIWLRSTLGVVGALLLLPGVALAISDLERAQQDFVCSPDDESTAPALRDELFDESALPDILLTRDESEGEEAAEDEADGPIQAEEEEMDAWRTAFKRFEERSSEFASEVNRVISWKYDAEITELRAGYDSLIKQANAEEKELRDLAIEALEAFVRDHPDSPYTARRMVRLAELYYEQAQEEYLAANVAYRELDEAFLKGEVKFLPEPPEKDLRRSIALYKRLIKKFPDYEELGVVYYMLGYCYSDEQSRFLDVDRAEQTYLEMLDNVEESAYRAQAYFRLGDIYFEENDWGRALSYYQSIVDELEAKGVDQGDEDSERLYELSLYKLAWAYYKIDDLPVAIARFTSLLDWAEQKEARTGKEADLKPETIRYLAISLSDLAAASGQSPIGFARASLVNKTSSPWLFPVYIQLASILKDQARYEDAIEAYTYLQQASPNHPMGPEFQWQVILLNQNLVIPDQAAADRARIVLTDRYGAETEWGRANKNNKEATSRARDYILESLQFVAFGYHSQAQDTGDANDYRLASEKYIAYLEQYPFAPNAYELHYYLAECYFFIGREPVSPSAGAASPIGWEMAIGQYAHLFSFPEDQYRTEAVTNIMKAYNRLWKHTGGDIEQIPESLVQLAPPLGEKVQYSTVDITPLEQNYIRAVRWVQREVSGDPDLPIVLYDVGRIYFYKNHLDRARLVFKELIEKYPRTNYASFAAGHIIDSYRLTGDLVRMRDAGERFAMLDLGEDPEIMEIRNDQFATLAKQSLAKDGELAYGMERYECALLSFLEYYQLYGEGATSRDPQMVDVIVYNIALSYSKLGKAADSDRYYKLLLRDFPESEKAPNTFWKMAQNAEQVFDLSEAIDYYLALRKYHSGHKDVANALLNAGFLAIGLKRFDAAAARYGEYHDTYTEDEKSPGYLYRSAELWESHGNTRKARKAYERWLELYGDTDADRWVETHYKLAGFARDAGKKKEAERRIRLIDESYDALRMELTKSSGLGMKICAEIRFQTLIEAYEDYAAFAITNVEDLEIAQAQIVRKVDWNQEVAGMMETFIQRYTNFEWQTAALYYKAASYQNHAETWVNSPNPWDGESMDDEEIGRFDAYQQTIEQQAEPFEQIAITGFKLVVEQAQAKKRHTRWVDEALKELNRVDPNTYPVPKPEESTVIPADSFSAPPAMDKAPGLSRRSGSPEAVRFADRREQR
ncbi:MAG: tetratricopeptide repeat protein [Myxococcota bacterium]|nr:tetratricopeptide repeat protein [Myxococcota bacterium]